MSDEKRYVGKGWGSKYGINISLKIADLQKLIPNNYGDIFLTVCERKEADAKSKATHYVIVDEYRNKPKEEMEPKF